MKTPHVTLSSEDALILQTISESGEEDIIGLAQSLGMNRRRVMAGLENLRKKGLITVKRISGDWWVRVSAKGKRLTHRIWPEFTVGSLQR